jgi:transposase
MGTPRYQLTPEAISALGQAEQQERHGGTRTRIQAVRLYSLGYAVDEITLITGLSRTRLLECWAHYRADGVAALADHRQGGNNRKLTVAQRAEVRTLLHQLTPRQALGAATATATGAHWTVADLRAAVQQWFGVSYPSTTSYYTLFAACDFSFQRPDGVFKSRRSADVLQWEADTEKN